MKILAGLPVVVLCLAVLAVAAVHVFIATAPGQRLALNLVNSLIPGTITCRDASISLLGGSVDIANGTLSGPDGREIIRVDRLQAGIDLLPLLRRRVVLTSLSASRPVVTLVRHRDGTFNIIRALVKEEEEKPEKEFQFVLGDFQARDGAVSYEDEGESLRTRLDGVGLRGSFDFPRSAGWASASIRDAHMDLEGFPLDLQGTTMRARLAGETLDPLFIETHRGRCQVAASGSVRELFTRPDLDLVFDASGEIADLASLFGQGARFSGNASAVVRTRGVVVNPEVSCRVAFSGGTVAGLPVEGLNLEARLKDRIVTLDKADASLYQGRLSLAGQANLSRVFPRGFLSPGTGLRNLGYALSGTASGMNLRKMFPGSASLPQSVSGRASLEGTGIEPPHVAGTASYDLRLAGLPASVPVSGGRADIKGRAVLQYPMLDLAASARTGSATRARGNGRVDLGEGTVRGTMDLTSDRVEEILASRGVPARGSFRAAAEISGPLRGPRIAASMEGHGLRWKDSPAVEAHADATLDQSGRIEVPALSIASGQSLLTARGSVKVFEKGFTLDKTMPLELSASLTAGDIRQLMAPEGARGSLEGDAFLEGSLFDPSGTFSIRGKGVSWKEITLGDVALQGSMSHGVVEVRHCEVANNGSVLTASGRADVFDVEKRRLRRDPGIELTSTGTIRDLSSFTPMARGAASLDAHIGGTLTDPHGTVRATGTGIEAWEQGIEGFTLSAALANRRITVETLEVDVARGQKISGTGWLALDRPWRYAAALKSEGIGLTSFPALRKFGVTGGNLLLDITGQGVLENPQLKGNAFITSLTVNGEPHKDVFIHLQMNGNRVNVLGESNFGFNGSYDLATRNIDARAIFKDTELEPYFRIGGRPELNGVLTGDAVISGNAKDIEDIDLDMHVAKVDILFREDRILHGEGLSLTYHDRRLLIPRSRITLLEQGSMVVQAQTDRNGSMDLAAQGLIPLEIAPLFLPGLEDLMGTLRFGISLKGPIASPKITGDLYLDDAQYYISYNDQMVHAVNGHVRLEENQALIQELRGMLDEGSFTIGGRVGLKDFTPVSVDLHARGMSLPVAVPDTANLILDANASLAGTPDSTLLSGNAVILEGSYYKDVRLNLIAEVGQRFINEQVRRRGGAGKPIDLPFLRGMDLDVSISRRGTVSIDNNLVDATLNPDLQITGTLNAPVVTGRVSVIQGTVTYQKRTFDITRGVIDFSNPYRTTAAVDVSAQGKIRDWTITLEVTGPLDNLNINLSSNPATDTSTIMSLLATGRTPEELVGKPGEVAESPSSMLAGVLASTYGEQVRKTTGIDIFQLESGTQQSGTQTQDIKITVGEKLTRRLTVKYSVATGTNDLTRTTSAEYRLLEHILLNGFQDSKGDFGGDVQLRLEFR